MFSKPVSTDLHCIVTHFVLNDCKQTAYLVSRFGSWMQKSNDQSIISFHSSRNLYSMRGMWFGHTILPTAVIPHVATFKESHRSCLKLHKSVKLDPSLEAKDSLTIKKFTVLCNPTVHYRVMTSQPRAPTTNHVNPVRTIPSYLITIHSNDISLQSGPPSKFV